MLCFRNTDDFFELDVPLVEDSSVQSVNGAVVALQVQSGGFSGGGDLWVDAQDLKKFARALIQLEQTLKGEASLESMSPNELSLKVFALTSRGHLAVRGSVGRHVQKENHLAWHRVSFGFEFEPSQLSAAISEPWVKNAA